MKVPLSLHFTPKMFRFCCNRLNIVHFTLRKSSVSVAFLSFKVHFYLRESSASGAKMFRFRCVFCLKPYQYQSVTHPYNIYKCITFEYKERKIRQVSFFFFVDISFIEGLYCNKTGTFFRFSLNKTAISSVIP